jgi:hypothetical protein
MILFKYPTRSRPDLFRSTMTAYLSLMSGKHDFRFIISCDADDETMNTPEIREWIGNLPHCDVFYNPPPQTKVSAINANMAGVEFDLCILCSDDMIPQVRGYDDRIVTLFNRHFPDGDGVLHLNDGRVGKTLNTLAIQDNKYFGRTGYIYHSDYESLFCDDEFQAVSELLNRSVYVNETVIAHRWTDVTGRDALHLRNEAFYPRDGLVFRKRKSAGFPKGSVL